MAIKFATRHEQFQFAAQCFNCLEVSIKSMRQGFPSGTVVESLPANAGDTGSSPGPGRSHMPRSN